MACSNRLRILVGADVPKDPNSGAAGTVFHTNQELRELGHELDEFWVEDLPHWIHHGNLHYLLELPRGYRRTVRRRCTLKKYDVIQLSQPYAWLAAKDHQKSGRDGVFINRSHGLELMADTIVSSWHHRLGIPENRFPRFLLTTIIRSILHQYTYKVAHYCDGMIVPSFDSAEFLVQHVNVNEEKLAVIPHGVPDVFVKKPPVLMNSERQQRILYVGQFAFIKGPMTLAKSVNQIMIANKRCEFTWVCSKEHHKEARSLLSPDTARRTCFLDWQEQSSLMRVYDEHGIFIFPSFFEGFGKAFLEAMSRGLCIVASDTGGMRDVITDGLDGYLLPVGDSGSLARKALDIMSSPQRARDVGERARQTAVTYTWESAAKNTVEFYESLIVTKKAKRNIC